MKLSIIIPTKDRPAVFNSTILKVIEALQGIDAEVIVVNDSKTSDVFIPESSADIEIHNNPKSGADSARNFGASIASGDLLLFMDDDILISKENIITLFHLHHLYPRAAINLVWNYPPELLRSIQCTPLGRFLVRYGFTSMKDAMGSEWQEAKIFETTGTASFFLFMHQTSFLISGGYNEYFPHAGSDYDFSMRLKEKGIKKLIHTNSMVYHNELDRINIDNWLKRQQNGAETRAWGFVLGRNELKLNTSYGKKIVYSCLYILSPLLFLFV